MIEYITSKFSNHFDSNSVAPSGEGRFGLQTDGLVHVCLYFIAAHRLKGVDVEFMRRLEKYVNLVPVIAKADTMTVAERDAFRRLIVSELRANGVRIFQLEDPSAHDAASKLGNTAPPPFAVCASEDGARVYPWGTLDVEDPMHSDLSILRTALFATSMLAAKRSTLALYETSYAAGRREQESWQQRRQLRALQNERTLGRLMTLVVGAGSLGALGSMVRPDLTLAARQHLQHAAATLGRSLAERLRNVQWRQMAVTVFEAVGALVNKGLQRAIKATAPKA